MMKRLIFYIILFLSAGHSIQVRGQQSVSIELSFERDDFNLVSTGDDLFRIETSEDIFFYSEELDQPAIPYRSMDVLVPNGAQFVDVEFSFKSEDIPGVVKLSKIDLPIPFSVSNEGMPTESASAFSGVFPEQVIKYNSPEMMQGYTWFNFTVAPFFYDSQTGILELITHLNILITYNQLADLQHFPRREEQVLNSVMKRVENPEDMGIHYLNKEYPIVKSSQDNLDYLIVTTSALKDEFLPLAEWKTRKGLKIEIITLDEIYSRFNASTPQLKIKYCLQEYYMERNLKWVLLGGDHNVVPVQPCFGTVLTDVEDNTIPTDLFYACFDKSFDWNAHMNDRIGEPYWDYIDLFPEVYIARAPVNTRDEVEIFVRKSIKYELSVPQEDFADKILLAGIKSWNIWDGKSDNHHRNEKMYHSHIASNWSGTRYGYYDTGTDFPGGEEYQVSAVNLSEQINNSYSMFHFAGHGNYKTYLMEEGPDFSTIDASLVKNQYPGIMLSSACDANAFDSDDLCMSEAFLRNPVGGCVAFWGSSRFGLDIPDNTDDLGPSYRFNAKFLEYLYRDNPDDNGKSFAMLTSLSKAGLTGAGSSGGSYSYLQYALNAMGDPELPLYSRNPSIFDNVRIYKWGDQLSVNTGGVEKSRICVTSQDLDQGYQVVAEGTSNYTFYNIPESFQVTITKQNHIPYRYFSSITSNYGADYISDFRIYPNPADDMITIEFNYPEGSICIIDLNGKILVQEDISIGSNIVSLTGLSKGIYIVKLRTSQGTDYVKLHKQ